MHMYINGDKQKINIAMYMYMHDDIRFRTKAELKLNLKSRGSPVVCTSSVTSCTC